MLQQGPATGGVQVTDRNLAGKVGIDWRIAKGIAVGYFPKDANENRAVKRCRGIPPDPPMATHALQLPNQPHLVLTGQRHGALHELLNQRFGISAAAQQGQLHQVAADAQFAE